MATRRKVRKPRQGKPAARRPDPVDDDLALADELIREAHESQAEINAEWEKFMKQLGIRGKPIGAKKLRERMIKEGIDPESNEFSRGIIEMREE
jgi:hypothetical protein